MIMKQFGLWLLKYNIHIMTAVFLGWTVWAICNWSGLALVQKLTLGMYAWLIVHEYEEGYKGRFLDDVAIASGDRDFVKLMDSISADKRDVRTMLQESYLARSMLMYGNFVRFDTRTQFFILTSLVDVLSDKYRSKRQNHQFLVGAMNNLLKQMLVANDTEAFNWVVNVMKIGYGEASAAMWSDLYARIPKSIGDAFGRTLNTFEETVFEMNMVETQFDVLDLFMLIYLFEGKLFKGMRENVELLEFFNLPFDWNELEKLKPNWRL